MTKEIFLNNSALVIKILQRLPIAWRIQFRFTVWPLSSSPASSCTALPTAPLISSWLQPPGPLPVPGSCLMLFAQSTPTPSSEGSLLSYSSSSLNASFNSSERPCSDSQARSELLSIPMAYPSVRAVLDFIAIAYLIFVFLAYLCEGGDFSHCCNPGSQHRPWTRVGIQQILCNKCLMKEMSWERWRDPLVQSSLLYPLPLPSVTEFSEAT